MLISISQDQCQVKCYLNIERDDVFTIYRTDKTLNY